MTASNDRQRSVNDRIRVAAAARGIDSNRLRRSLVLQRLLARLDDSGLVLKGGYCLEARLPGMSRATKDVDLVGRLATLDDPDYLLDTLDQLLDARPLADGFSFRAVSAVRVRVRGEADESRAWRIRLTASLGGAPFEQIPLDLVGQLSEVVGATERLVVPPPLSLYGVDDVVVEAVDVYQHAAEKMHAYSRVYAHDRPSSRVKDLVDLVLLIEAGLIVEPGRLRSRLEVVHAARGGAPPPPGLPHPPGDWTVPYAALAADLDLTAASTDAADDLVARWYAAALTEGTLQ